MVVFPAWGNMIGCRGGTVSPACNHVLCTLNTDALPSPLLRSASYGAPRQTDAHRATSSLRRHPMCNQRIKASSVIFPRTPRARLQAPADPHKTSTCPPRRSQAPTLPHPPRPPCPLAHFAHLAPCTRPAHHPPPPIGRTSFQRPVA